MEPSWVHLTGVKNWLHGQAQRVKVNGAASSWGLTTSGDPQGSVLGLALFNIFTGDVDSQVKSTHGRFTDNTN